MITSVDAEYESENSLQWMQNSQHPFIIKTINKLGIEGMYPNIIEAIHDKCIGHR